jgi:hypothetical protein
MKVSSIFLGLASLVSLALTNPVPDYVVLPRVTTTSAVATITPGTTGVPASQANPAGSANIGLVSQARNHITSGLPYKSFTPIFARGTLEAGNIGGIVGPPLVDALVSILGSDQIAVQRVNNYPTDVAGFLAGGSATGRSSELDIS